MVSGMISKLYGHTRNRHSWSSFRSSDKPVAWHKKVETESLDSDKTETADFYPEDIETIREHEFPLLKDTTYLDHGGATLYAKSVIESFAREMNSNLFGNPHSASPSSMLSTQRVDDARVRLLQFFNASPDEFDLVFVPNATGAIKVVAEALRDYDERGFWYGYHVDAHTSLVGPREVAKQGSRCFVTEEEIKAWIDNLDVGRDSQEKEPSPRLFAYPAQSNMNGYRMGLDWCKAIREKTKGKGNVFTLYDAAAYATSSPLDFSKPESCPDFTAMSLYKIFGFPDLGVLIVRKSAGYIFEKRKYFGGGTVGMVISLGDQWHAKKNGTIHDCLEDGTLPFHNIVAVHCAIDEHQRIYGSMQNVARHCAALSKNLYSRLEAMRHYNGTKVFDIYKNPRATYGDPTSQGPVIAFNMRDSSGNWIGKSEVEKLATVKNIHIRSGGHCNPGGISTFLHLSADEMKENYAEGLRCGDENDIMGGKPSGALRVSLGPMSSMQDVDTFVNFVSDYYHEKESIVVRKGFFRKSIIRTSMISQPKDFYIEKLCVYPIKSCGAFVVPSDQTWEIRPQGLAWDREWCLIHLGTNSVLSQKKYPKMALIQPEIDLDASVLEITCKDPKLPTSLRVPLTGDGLPGHVTAQMTLKSKSATVCGEVVSVQACLTPKVIKMFSDFLGVPCTLARFPSQSSMRHYQPRGASHRRNRSSIIGAIGLKLSTNQAPIALSNESPILLISRSSVNRLNEDIKARREKASAVPCDAFRANIIVNENPFTVNPASRARASNFPIEHPYAEDLWSGFSVGDDKFDVLSSCQRCQMVSVDQQTGERRSEPYSTLAKTRKLNGKVFFGRHVALRRDSANVEVAYPKVMVGDLITPHYETV